MTESSKNLTRSFTLHVSGDIGNVSAEYLAPSDCFCMMTLAHGAGAGMNHSFMLKLANALSEVGIGTLRFNFPFIENKKKRVDAPPVAHQTISAAINHARQEFPSLPLLAAGKSFGGRMSSQYLSGHPQDAVDGIVFYGFPLHPAGKPSTERSEHLKDVNVPMLFLQGTRDELATWELIESVCSSLPLATLVKIEKADHSFKAGKTDVVEILKTETKEWVRKILASKSLEA